MRRLVFFAAVIGTCAAACASTIFGFDAVSLAPIPDASTERPDANLDGSSDVAPTGACGAPLGTSDNCAACGHSCLGAACVDGGCETIPLLSGATNPAALVLDKGAVYIATFDDVLRIDKETNASFDVLRGGTRGAFIESLAVDESLVYWGERQASTFACPKTGCPDAGGTRQGPAATNPIAIALAGGDLVWNDGLAARLFAVDRRTGQDTRALSSTLVRSRTLATDETAIYVPNGDDQAILRIALDGGSTTTLAHTTAPATALTLVGSTVFFGASDGSLGVVRTNGGGAVAFAARTTSVASLASDGNHIYWADRGTTAANGQRQSDGCIYRCPLATCTVAKPTAVRCGLSTPTRIAVDENAIYWTNLGPGMENDLPVSGSAAKMAKPPP